MTYDEAIDFLEKSANNNIRPGLERVCAMLNRLGDPHKKLKVIHIAGTNGKGSTSALISSALIEQGYKTGVYTSPHLEKYNERYSLNGKNISDDDFISYCERIKRVYNDMKTDGEPLPTVFEMLTCLGFCFFADNAADYLVLEVGLGGAFDATNVVKTPVLSVITQIGFDHMDYLGNTIDEIAKEKCGIIKKNVPCVLYYQDKRVYNIVKKKCDEFNSRLYYDDSADVSDVKYGLNETAFSVKSKFLNYDNIKLRLIGEYQIKNCLTALLAIKALNDCGVEISEESALNGVAKATWRGRMELALEKPTVILDGAHNVDGIKALAESVKRYFSGKKITLVMGVLGDKEYKKMANLIIPLAQKLVLTEPESARKLSTEGLRSVIDGQNAEIYEEKLIDNAMERAISVTAQDDVIICAGSLYMIGEARSFLSRRKLCAANKP